MVVVECDVPPGLPFIVVEVVLSCEGIEVSVCVNVVVISSKPVVVPACTAFTSSVCVVPVGFNR